MKNLVVAICVFSSFSFFAQTKYTVTLSTTENLKDRMRELTTNVSSYNRYIYPPNTLTFCFNQELSDAEIASKLTVGSISSITREKTKTKPNVDKAGGSDCEDAEVVCSNSNLPGSSDGFGIQELTTEAGNYGCLYEEYQSSWYYLNVEVGGQLQFKIQPTNEDDDYDFALWGPFTSATAGANCPPISAPIRCNYSGGVGSGTGVSTAGTNNYEPEEGPGFSNAVDVLAGEIYILLIDNHSASLGDFNLDFDWFGFASTAVLGCNTVVLPAELIHFSGEKNTNNILSWSTASELNNDYFTIEHSVDGTNWNRTAHVNGAGTSNSIQYYSFGHSDFGNTLNYYRLSQTDFDGQRKFLSTLAIDNSIHRKEIVKITNLLGQEVDSNYSGLRIIRFRDGSTIKKMGAN